MATNTKVRDFVDVVVTHTGAPYVELNVFFPSDRVSRIETTVRLSADDADRLGLQLIRKAIEARKAQETAEVTE